MRRDELRPFAWLTVALAVLLAVAVCWMTLAPIKVRVASVNARLEAEGSSLRVESPVSGEVSRVLVKLGDAVEEGQPLVELDARDQRLQVERAKIMSAGLAEENASLKRQQAAIRAAADARLGELRGREVEAEAQTNAALSARDAARRNLDRARKLQDDGILSVQELEEREQAASGADSARIVAAAREALLQSTSRASHYGAKADLEKLATDIARNERLLAEGQNALETAQLQLSKLVIVAPLAGRIGSMSRLAKGQLLKTGALVASVVPPSTVTVRAAFAPGPSLGKLRVGQPARVRFAAFSWTQYGHVPGRVTAVGNQPENGFVSVLVSLDPAAASFELQHGLEGQVDVVVEQTTPLRFLIRSLGAREWDAPPPVHPLEQRSATSSIAIR